MDTNGPFRTGTQKKKMKDPVKHEPMSKKLILLSTIFFWALIAGAQNEYREAYIHKFSGIAIREMERAGVPASIKLAQAILESDAGRSDLARRANNHFGIKCGGNWNGRKVYKEDDDVDDRGRLIESCFRVYRDVEASFVGHSEFLRDPKKADRYGFLFRLNPLDYRRWAIGLKQAGYATSATYHTKLINIIETYGLDRYDAMTSTDLIVSTDFSREGFLTLNDVKYVLAAEDETVEEIARRTDITLRRLIKYNEKIDDAEERLNEGRKIFLQRKRCAYRGKKTWHYVHEQETMFDISQLYGVRLSKLYKRNRMEEGEQPAVNERIKVRGGKVKERPALRGEKRELPPIPELLFDELVPEIDVEELTPEPEIPMEEPAIPTRPAPSTPENVRPVPPPPANSPVEEPLEEDELFEIEPNRPPRPATEPKEEPLIENPFQSPQTTPERPPVREEPPPAPPPAGANFHTVETGDTLWNISRRYNTTVETIVRLNGLTDYTIKVGQRLRVK